MRFARDVVVIAAVALSVRAASGGVSGYDVVVVLCVSVLFAALFQARDARLAKGPPS